ncbi:MAG: lipoate--protein ligase family protein [Chlamydiales bacterium]|nr:lipoate--protein ligase family protein [Chlamydiales bacterium]
MNLLRLENFPIWEQLKLEEALVRTDKRNWCIINSGSPQAIVMGISGKPEQLIDLNRLSRYPVPVIKRFSGGGTVVVDQDTLFVSFICQHGTVPVHPYPQDIMRWTSQFYRPLLEGFDLRENDYVLGNTKFGGNAQYLRKDCWLHHSTLLWDYQAANMEYLTLPSRRPNYRQSRPHSDFLCKLKDYLPCRHDFLKSFCLQLSIHFDVVPIELEEVISVTERTHRQATELCEL